MQVLITTLRSRLAQADLQLQDRHLRAARTAFEDLLQAAQEKTDRPMEVIARSMLAGILVRQRKLDEASEELDLASRLLDPEHVEAYGRYRSVLARVAVARGPEDTAHNELLAYIRWAEDNGADDEVLDASMLLADASPLSGRCEWLRHGIEHGLNHGVRRSLGRAYNDLGAALDELGEIDEALEAYQQSLNWHNDAGDVRQIVGASWAVGAVACRLEEWPLARTRLEEAVTLAEADEGCADLLVFVLADLAQVYDAAGDVVEARRLVIRALRDGRINGIDAVWPQRWDALVNHAKQLDLDPFRDARA